MSSWASFSSQVKKKKEPVRDDLSLQASSIDRSSKESKISNVGASSSFLGLKAELAGRKSGVKHTRSDESILDKREKKLPAHLRPAPDVLARSLKHDRNQTTSSWANTPSSQLDATRRALERKAAMYEKLKRGETGGLDEQSFQDSLIDWDRKEYEHGREDSESEESEDEVRQKATNSDDDPLTEYEDDLGRMRKVRRSEVPRSALKAKQEQEEEEGPDEELVTYGAATSFPVFKPDPIQRAEAQKAEAYKRRGVDHFDAEYEKRYRGAGFYHFSQDEETRKKQMDALKADRDETERARAEMSNDDAKLSVGERRREERRKLVAQKKVEIEEKRKRYAGEQGGSAPLEQGPV